MKVSNGTKNESSFARILRRMPMPFPLGEHDREEQRRREIITDLITSEFTKR